MGIPELESFNAKDYIGFGKSDGTLNNGLRVNAAEAFLAPAKDRENLFVITSATGQKITMSGKKAVGVRVKLSDDRVIDVKASKEVILSAGAIESPKLLMLSGIGPKNHLKEFGISALVDLPVGQNLQDHALTTGVQFSYDNKSYAGWKPSDLLDSAYTFLVHKKGMIFVFIFFSLISFINKTYTRKNQLQKWSKFNN